MNSTILRSSSMLGERVDTIVETMQGTVLALLCILISTFSGSTGVLTPYSMPQSGYFVDCLRYYLLRSVDL